FTLDLLYIAVSRIKTLEGIIFKYPFEFATLRIKNTKFSIYRNINITKRIPQ
ncbi:hypothetical protein QBC45DRAFT_340778, partial [Copromyces sp. CBS 386.78]